MVGRSGEAALGLDKEAFTKYSPVWTSTPQDWQKLSVSPLKHIHPC